MRGPFELVVRDPQHSEHNSEMALDGNAAYQNALMWCLTGKEAHAKKAVELLNAWSATLKKMDGRDVQLGAGLNGFKFVNAAELMRATYPSWSVVEIAQCQTMLKQAVYPPLKDFATFANGNWDGACIKAMMAIGVFCDDHEMFNRAVEYFYRGSGNGAITHYIVNTTGQCQESGRDQSHTQLGLGQLAEACEIGWHQGLDMYGAEDNRLLAGFEYTAKYLLGNDVPFEPHTDTTGKYRATVIAPRTRQRMRPFTKWFGTTTRTAAGSKRPSRVKRLKKIVPKARPTAPTTPASAPCCFHGKQNSYCVFDTLESSPTQRTRMLEPNR